MQIVGRVIVGDQAERLFEELRQRTDRWRSLDEGGPPSGWTPGSSRRYAVPLLRERNGGFELRRRDWGNANPLAPVVRVELEESGDRIRLTVRHRFVAAWFAISVAFFAIAAVVFWSRGDLTSALLFLAFGLVGTTVVVAGERLMARDDQRVLVSFIQRIAIETVRPPQARR